MIRWKDAVSWIGGGLVDVLKRSVVPLQVVMQIVRVCVCGLAAY